MQTPPDVKIVVSMGSLELIRVVALGARDIGTYQAHQEYWRYRNARLCEDMPDVLRIRVTPLADYQRTEQWIDAFFSGYHRGGTFPRLVTREDWRECDATSMRSNGRLLCFRPRREDDEAFWIGIEWDNTSNALAAFYWYRQSRPEDGQAFGSSDFTVDLVSAERSRIPRYYFRHGMPG